TTFTTPYLIKYSENFYNFLVKILPAKWVVALNAYSTSTQHIQAESSWKTVLTSYIKIVITNGIIILALILLTLNFFMPFLEEKIYDPTIRSIIGLIVSLGISAPFLWALMAKKPDILAYREL